MEKNPSVFEPQGYFKHVCGYCKDKTPSSYAYYANANYCQLAHYEALINKGWRRSGTTYYKPDVRRSCCPQYTIRVDATRLNPRRDQRQTIHRWNKYVLGYEYISKTARLVPRSREEKRAARNKFDLCKEIHRSEYEALTRPVDPKTRTRIEPQHRFRVTMESDKISDEKYQVFLRYQTTIHHERASKWNPGRFESFLCSGFYGRFSNTPATLAKPKALGSFHQCYYLDSKLIAVGVLDLLPNAISSVYFFYDPEYQSYGLGKLSFMREAALALESDYRYNYMGFYIHTCVKMRYKADVNSCSLLDPETYEWEEFDKSYREKLDSHKYVCLSRERKGLAELNKNDLEIQDEDIPRGSGTISVPPVSVMKVNMPGVLTLEQVMQEVDLGKLVCKFHGSLYHLNDFIGWSNWDPYNALSPKGRAADLAATMGSELIENIVLEMY